MTSLTLNQTAPMPSLRSGRKFRNAARMRKVGLGGTLKIMWKVLLNKPDDAQPRYEIPVRALTSAELLSAPDNTVYRLGHSTLLLKLNDELWLTDPVFSERASPVQWAGPSRFHAPPISIDELPPIRGVILSHNHYDHLDYAAVRKLAAKTDYFIAPLGVGDTLVKWGVPADKVRQLDWWQSTAVGKLGLTATPAQHFSGRTPFDGNETLWASWVLDTGSYRVFFSGDSGYFKGFKEIGDQFGPFDLTLMETGAYDPMWPDVHMQPEETLRAHRDLRGKVLMPIHNGTFDLALHSWQDPFERISKLAAEQQQVLATPAIGEPLSIALPAAATPWWRAHE
jgi:L-ascorbate metabolism protein UlaG (beta-lactamase superfamily)